MIEVKNLVIQLRKQGKSYSEIQKEIQKPLPKSTIATWCRDVRVPKKFLDINRERSRLGLARAREASLISRKLQRGTLVDLIDAGNKELPGLLKNKNIAKISLALLYLAEGSKSKRGSLMFGNSDPEIVRLFMKLLRQSYVVDETKFRCTLQCRADQDIVTVEKFWAKITKIPLKQFYKPQIDSRTLGRPTKKENYKGVCRIDYFSSKVDLELKRIVVLINQYYLGPIV